MIDEKAIEQDLKKDISQDESIDPSVEKYLNEMGYVWDRLQKKFQEDNICFHCKESVTGKKTFVLEANKSDKGVFVLAVVCEDCFSKLQAETKQTKKLK